LLLKQPVKQKLGDTQFNQLFSAYFTVTEAPPGQSSQMGERLGFSQHRRNRTKNGLSGHSLSLIFQNLIVLKWMSLAPLSKTGLSPSDEMLRRRFELKNTRAAAKLST